MSTPVAARAIGSGAGGNSEFFNDAFDEDDDLFFNQSRAPGYLRLNNNDNPHQLQRLHPFDDF